MPDTAITREDFTAALELLGGTEGLDEEQFVGVLGLDREVLHAEAHGIIDHGKDAEGMFGCDVVVIALLMGIVAERQRQARTADPEVPS